MSATGTVDFLSMKAVLQRTGLSKTEIYRKIAAGTFPRQRSYRDNPKKVFWASSEVAAWQRSQIGDDEFEALLG